MMDEAISVRTVWGRTVDLAARAAQPSPPLLVKTHEFLSKLYPHPERLLKSCTDGRNHWIQRQIIVYGAPGSGKTCFVEWLVEKAVEKYGLENVAYLSVQGDLAGLLSAKYPPKPVIILFDDDATMEKLSPETVRLYTHIRHKCMQDTGLNRGLVVTITGLHRLTASNPLIRANFNMLVVRSPPSGKYDYDYLKFYIGAAGLAYLDELERLREDDERYLGYAVFANPFSELRGIVANPLARKYVVDYVRIKVEKDIAEEVSTETLENELQLETPEIPEPQTAEPKAVSFEDYIIMRAKKELKWKDEYVLAFKTYLEVRDLTEAARTIGRTSTALTKTFKPLREEKLGYWFEDYIHSLFGTKPNRQKNKPLPDLVAPNGDIYSLKCYWVNKDYVTVMVERDCKPEIEEAKRRGAKRFRLLFYNVLWRECHMVELDPENPPPAKTFRRGDRLTIIDIYRLIDAYKHANANTDPSTPPQTQTQEEGVYRGR